MKKVELIFIPTPGIGHVVSTIEFAKRLIHQDDRIWITILSMKWFSNIMDAYTKSLTASQPDRIQLIDIPHVDPPSFDLLKLSAEAYIYASFESYIPPVRNAVRNIVSRNSSSDSTRVAGLVLDLFCAPMIDIATELDLPSYIFLTTNTAFLGLMLYLTTRHSQNSSEFESTDPDHLIPGFVNPVPSCVLPSAVFNRDGGYTTYFKIAERFKDAKGIMINTFEELESYALNCFSNGQNPPIYPVGPVIHLNWLPHPELDLAQRDKVMKWLDDQPQSSVVFLCFGSMGSYGAPQVKEIALGLEQSGCRFLWSLRAPPSLKPENDASGIVHHKNPKEMLPEGFIERIQGRGMICGWVPQVEVLAHKAIGGFVSHCGWNSILESLWFGVPIVTWPMFAEQQLNAYMMKELGVAVVLRLDYRRDMLRLDYRRDTSDVVMADEIGKAVRMVMDGGSEVRKKVKEMAKMARKAITEGGSSINSIGRLIEDMIGNS
ncbi:UDP-glycosyltransferase 71K1-like [Durio zibethinus]|uniref:Glycosyltransferase n=1 Tax=Durio zibethinus TaxID=66656 RepID=A0A6P5XSC7_DURZI|nr:UDP-glycosyltransferase 71K1-like [Durio zibethinus]